MTTFREIVDERLKAGGEMGLAWEIVFAAILRDLSAEMDRRYPDPLKAQAEKLEREIQYRADEYDAKAELRARFPDSTF